MSFPETTDTEPPVPSKDEEVPAAPAAAPDSTEEATKDVSAEPSSKPKKNKNHVKDYKTGISFSVHASPFRASVKSSSASLEPLKPIPAKYRLATEEDALSMSMLALRVAVLATACGQTVLQPNFPFLVLEGHPDAFPNTDPFGFSSALYFLPLTTMLGTAITSAVVGQLSDRIGRRPCILVCVGMMAITLVVQFFAQNTFWGFCAASFLNGLFCSSLPVAMAYASDVHTNRAKKDEEIGVLVGFNMLGMSGGGVVAILMENLNLFTPLLVAAAVDFGAFLLCYRFLIEPSKDLRFKEDSDEDEEDAPKSIDWKLFWNVIAGALLDNFGSSGLFPLTLAPLAFNTYLQDFLLVGEDPIMSPTAYKWLSVCVALMVVPGAVLTQPVFAKIGAAGGCVVGNAITAVGIALCIMIASLDPTEGTFAGFIICLYMIFPLTVISQLSTGPMLDMLAPPEQRGFAQGINMTVMNFAFAVSPWLLGLMSDNVGVNQTLWFCVGLSILAAVVNAPLMFASALKRKPPVDYQQAMGLEDQDLVDKALRGEWVPAKFLDDLNYSRFQNGMQFLRMPVVEYSADKENMRMLKRHAREDFLYHRITMTNILNELQAPGGIEKNVELFKKVQPPEEHRNADADAMGKWFTEYMKDNGYFIDGGFPAIYKQMIMHAFPPINTDGEINENNIETTMVNYLANVNRLLRDDTNNAAIRGFRNSVVVG